ncbi:hypothetical protein PINS_up012518 [Pythium insidiosum]|nr:hypothetical protein PINS_up012518 [Pythium insidiosum]
MAERQLERRQKAEGENSRLRRTLERQIRASRSLEQLLRKRTSTVILDLFEGARTLPKRCRISNDVGDLYARFAAEIDEAYSMVDDVLQDASLHSSRLGASTPRGYKVRTRQLRGHEQLFVEMWDVSLVPFDAERAASVLWRAVAREWTSQHRTVHASCVQNDSFAVQFDARSKSRTRQGVLHVGLVAKRFIEKDRMVMVWRGTNSPAEDVEDWRHMSTQETGWLVVKKVPGSRTAAMIQACVYLFPKWFGAQGYSELVHHMKTGDFAMLVTNSYESDADHIVEAVENALLDECIAGASP